MVRNSLDRPLPLMSPPRSSSTSATPRSFSSATACNASRAERNRRSSFAATTVSPRWSPPQSRAPSGRCTRGTLPDTPRSTNTASSRCPYMWLQPSSTRRCTSRLSPSLAWAAVLTLQYPQVAMACPFVRLPVSF